MKKATRKSSIGAKPRNIADPEVKSFSTKFSLPSFVKRVGKLSSDQRIAIESMGFGSLLQIPSKIMCKNLIVELMERWSCEKRAFLLIHGEITITSMDVALILGLRVTGDPVFLKEDEPFSDLEREYGASLWKRKITITSIEERLESLGDVVNDNFIRTFLLFTFGTLLFPNSNGKVDSRYLSLLQNLDKVCHFSWGTAVLEDVTYWLCRRKEINVEYVGGCLIFIQVWCYEHIDIARPTLLTCSSRFPRVCQWGNSRSRQRKWYNSKFKELQKNQVLWKLEPTTEETNIDIVKELLEAGSDRVEACTSRYSSPHVSIDNASDIVRNGSKMMEQCVVDLESKSEMDELREIDGPLENFSKHLETLPNVRTVAIKNVVFSTASHHASEVQKEHVEYFCLSPDSSAILVISDDDEVNLRTSRTLEERNMPSQKEIDELRKENELLKDKLSSSDSNTKLVVEQNIELRKEVENLRRENQLLSLSSNDLVTRLERLVVDEVVWSQDSAIIAEPKLNLIHD